MTFKKQILDSVKGDLSQPFFSNIDISNIFILVNIIKLLTLLLTILLTKIITIITVLRNGNRVLRCHLSICHVGDGKLYCGRHTDDLTLVRIG